VGYLVGTGDLASIRSSFCAGQPALFGPDGTNFTLPTRSPNYEYITNCLDTCLGGDKLYAGFPGVTKDIGNGKAVNGVVVSLFPDKIFNGTCSYQSTVPTTLFLNVEGIDFAPGLSGAPPNTASIPLNLTALNNWTADPSGDVVLATWEDAGGGTHSLHLKYMQMLTQKFTCQCAVASVMGGGFLLPAMTIENDGLVEAIWPGGQPAFVIPVQEAYRPLISCDPFAVEGQLGDQWYSVDVFGDIDLNNPLGSGTLSYTVSE
jgi:hypothetical protein